MRDDSCEMREGVRRAGGRMRMRLDWRVGEDM